VRWIWDHEDIRGIRQVPDGTSTIGMESGFSSRVVERGKYDLTLYEDGDVYYVDASYAWMGTRGSITVDPLVSIVGAVQVRVNDAITNMSDTDDMSEDADLGSDTGCMDSAVLSNISAPTYIFSSCLTAEIMNVDSSSHYVSGGDTLTIRGSGFDIVKSWSDLSITFRKVCLNPIFDSKCAPEESDQTYGTCQLDQVVANGTMHIIYCIIAPDAVVGTWQVNIHIEGIGYVLSQPNAAMISIHPTITKIISPTPGSLGGAKLEIGGFGLDALSQIQIGGSGCEIFTQNTTYASCDLDAIVDDGYNVLVASNDQVSLFWELDNAVGQDLDLILGLEATMVGNVIVGQDGASASLRTNHVASTSIGGSYADVSNSLSEWLGSNKAVLLQRAGDPSLIFRTKFSRKECLSFECKWYVGDAISDDSEYVGDFETRC